MQTPVNILNAIGGIASVTSAESRLYWWLIQKHWLPLRRARVDITMDFTPSGQLAVHWNRSPSSRRLVMVVHTDREGYVVTGVETVEKGDAVVTARTYGTEVESFRKGDRVFLVGGLDRPEKLGLGTIEAVGVGSSGQEDAQSICIDGSFMDTDRIREILQRNESVTAHHWFHGSHDGVRVEANGRITCWGVDNVAGVAVATAALSRIAQEDLPCNVSVIYTFGEEAGFIGALLLNRDSDYWLLRDTKETTWLVVDCSDARPDSAGAMQIDRWRNSRFDKSGAIREGVPLLPHDLKACSHHMCGIRLEDRTSIFDLSASRFLYQASLSAKAKLARLQGRKPATWSKEFSKGVRVEELGLTGIYTGGTCEASILVHSSELGGTCLGRVGSLAIPIRNYRAVGVRGRFSEMVQISEPEESYVGALNSAFWIIYESSLLHEDYSFNGKDQSGYRRPNDQKGFPATREELTQVWNNRLDGWSTDTHLRRWVDKSGGKLVK